MENKTVLVTGSTRGIGYAVAQRLVREGYGVVVHGRREDAVQAVVRGLQENGASARGLCFDVAQREAARSALERDMEAHGAYYGVVLNAGITRDNSFPALRDDDWDSVLRTDLDGFFHVLHPVVMPMIRRRAPGRIVCIASVSGLIRNRGQVNYSAAKAGVIGAAKALALELAKRKITVNCVAPGLIDTDMAGGDVPVDEILKLIPAGRMGLPEEVAHAVNFLLSEQAAYITRQVLAVNGGLC